MASTHFSDYLLPKTSVKQLDFLFVLYIQYIYEDFLSDLFKNRSNSITDFAVICTLIGNNEPYLSASDNQASSANKQRLPSIHQMQTLQRLTIKAGGRGDKKWKNCEINATLSIQ